MADVICNNGLVEIAGALRTFFNGASLHLYTTNITPNITDTLATYAGSEASFPGYAPVNISSWGAAFLAGSGLAEIDELIRVFTLAVSGGPYPIYGYFVKSSSGSLLWAGLNSAAPINLSVAGDNYSVRPRFQEKNC